MANRFLILAAALACLAGAGWYTSRVEPGAAAPFGVAEQAAPSAVEESFAAETALIEAGKGDQALLSLRTRSEKGPHAGAAHFLLGEIAFGEKALAAAAESYVKAIEADRYLLDKGAAFDAGETMKARVDALRSKADPRRVNYLVRLLAGGCE